MGSPGGSRAPQGMERRVGSAQLPGDRDVHGVAADALVSKSSSYTPHRKGFKLPGLPQKGQR